MNIRYKKERFENQDENLSKNHFDKSKILLLKLFVIKFILDQILFNTFA